MADNEFRTLLVIDGDASGAKLAAQQAANAVQQQVAALQQLSAAEQVAAAAAQQRVAAVNLGATGGGGAARHGRNSSGSMFGETVESFDASAELMKTSQAAEKASEAVAKVGSAAGKSGEGFHSSSVKAEAFSQIISRISPEAGALIQTGKSLGVILESAFSPTGLITGALMAALAGVGVLINGIIDDLRKAKQEAEDAEKARARMEAERLQREMGVGGELGRMGVGSPEARAKAGELAKAWQGEGWDQAASEKVAARVLGSGAEIDEVERRRLLMLVQRGDAAIEGKTPTETRASIQRIVSRVAQSGGENIRAIDQGVAQMMQDSPAALQESAKGTEGFLEEELKRMGLDGETLKEKAEKIRGALKWEAGGRKPDFSVPLGGDIGDFASPFLDLAPEKNTEGLSLVEQIKKKLAEKQARQAEALRNAEAIPASGDVSQVPSKIETWSEVINPAETPYPADVAAQEEAKRRDRVGAVIDGLKNSVQKATLSPDELLKAQLAELGATQEEIVRALELQKQALDAVVANRPARQSFSPQPTQLPRFNPDAQNEPQAVIHNHNTFSGHVVIGDTIDPSARRAPRSPVR